MKKTVLRVLGAAVVASTLFLIGCSDITQGKFSSDTIVELEKPKVKAVAYPGKVYYTWTTTSRAAAYDVEVYKDNVLATYSKVTLGSGSPAGTVSTSTNGQKIRIRVAAVGTAARAVETLGSDFGEATVTSIVPPAGTHALQLAAYEGGYDGKVKTTKNTLSGGDIAVVKNLNSIYVNFPAKCYLNYNVAVTKDFDKTQEKPTYTDAVGSKLTTETNDSYINTTSTITTAGTYFVNVVANAGTPYIDDVVTASTKVTYESLFAAPCATNTFKAAYNEAFVNEDNKSVRLTWTPSKLNGEYLPTSYYKVYVRSQYSNELVEVKGEVKAAPTDNEDTLVYYVDTTVEDNTLSHTYTLVLTNDGKYGTTAPTATLAARTDAATSLTNVTINSSVGYGVGNDVATDALKNDITWTVKLNNKYQSLKAYLLEKDKDFEGTVVYADFDQSEGKALAVTKANNTDDVTYNIYTTDKAVGKYYLLIVVSEKDKKDSYKISSAATVAELTAVSVANATLDVTVYDNTVDATNNTKDKVNNDVIINFTDKIAIATDSVDFYEYKLYKASSTFKKDIAADTITYTQGDWDEGTELTMVEDSPKESDTTITVGGSSVKAKTYKAIITEADVADGVYSYKVVKTVKETGKFATVGIETRTVYTDKTSLTFSVSAQKAEEVTKDADGNPIDLTIAATKDVKLSFSVTAGAPTAIAGTGALKGYVVGYEKDTLTDKIAAVKAFNIYKKVSVTNDTYNYAVATVYTKVGEFPAGKADDTAKLADLPTYKLDTDAKTVIAGDPVKDVAGKYDYEYTDKGISTGTKVEYVLEIVFLDEEINPLYTTIGTVNAQF